MKKARAAALLSAAVLWTGNAQGEERAGRQPAGKSDLSLQDRLGPSPRLRVLPIERVAAPHGLAVLSPVTPVTATPAPATPAKAVAPAPTDAAGRPLSPKRLAKLQARGLIDDSLNAANSDRPPLASVHATPLPSTPGFAEGPRLVVMPARVNMPVRIPNLLSGSRRQMVTATNPLMTPALPIGTPTVCNTAGTTELAGLAPFSREIVVEVTAPPKALEFDEAPYIQAPGAEDELDAPAAARGAPVRPKME